MDSLFSWLKGLLDLQKAAAITIPGATIALALIFFFAADDKLTFAGYEFPVDANLKVPPVCNALSREAALESGDIGRMNLNDYTGIQSRRWQIEECVRSLQIALITEQQRGAALKSKIAAEAKSVDNFNDKFEEAANNASDLAPEYKAQRDAAIATLGADRRDSTESAVRTSYYKVLSDRWTAEQSSIKDRLKAVDAGEVFSDLTTKLTQKIILFSLVAIAIGFILNPLNKTLITIAYDQRGAPLADFDPTQAPAPSEKLPNSNLAIGQRLVSKEDLDAIRSGYYFAAELSVGMIIPLALLVFSLGVFTWRHFPDAGVTPAQSTLRMEALERVRASYTQ